MIAKGDTLARLHYDTSGRSYPFGVKLRLYNVKDVAPFAILISPMDEPDLTTVIEGSPDVVILKEVAPS